MPDKKISDVKKKIAGEVKKMGSKSKRSAQEIQKLQLERKSVKSEKSDKKEKDKKLKLIDLRIGKLHKDYFTQVNSAEARLNKLLKQNLPDNKTELEPWKKDLAPWYRKMIEKEAGFDVKAMGVKGKVWGDIDFEKKSAIILLKFKTP